jgi:hypothetical protein
MFLSFRNGILITMAACLSCVLWAQDPVSVGHIAVDPNQRFQRIDGFGLNFTAPYFREDQKAMFDKLVSDLGATMFLNGTSTPSGNVTVNVAVTEPALPSAMVKQPSPAFIWMR